MCTSNTFQAFVTATSADGTKSESAVTEGFYFLPLNAGTYVVCYEERHVGSPRPFCTSTQVTDDLVRLDGLGLRAGFVGLVSVEFGSGDD